MDLEDDYSPSDSAVVKGVWSYTTTVTVIFHYMLLFLAVAPSRQIASWSTPPTCNRLMGLCSSSTSFSLKMATVVYTKTLQLPYMTWLNPKDRYCTLNTGHINLSMRKWAVICFNIWTLLYLQFTALENMT